jgi:signal transduction histidine kinase
LSPWPARFLGLRRRQLFNIYVLLGSVGIVLAVTVFTLRISRQVEEQARLATRMFSSQASRLLGGDPQGIREVMQAVNEIQVPFIVTDPAGRPLLWNAPVIGVPMPERRSELQSVDPAAPRDPRVRRVLELVREYDREHEPFAIVDQATGRRAGTLHFGNSALSRHVRWMPYLELLLLAVFFLLIYWALVLKKQGEQQRLFAGMAKETAHQLGTPLMAMLGWLQILRDRHGDDEVITELDRDVARLGKVAERFSRIGSQPQLSPGDLTEVVRSSLAYFERRLPHLGGRVDLRLEGAIRNPVRFNRELMEWVLENLIKNGVDALKDGKGTIVVRLEDLPGGGVMIQVSDTGCGVPAGLRNRIFEPGFTTKTRGWGMGLALVRRIVTQYHGGRLQVAATSSRGTTFAVTLPGEETRSAVPDPVG